MDRSKRWRSGFYQYFESKDELLFALLEESIRESLEDLRAAVETESKPLERLRAFTIRLHEWCEPVGTRRKRGAHNRVPISEFSLQLALKNPERLAAAMEPISRMLIELLKAAVAAGFFQVADMQRAALLLQQTVMYGWLMNRFIQNSRARVSAEDAWEFCSTASAAEAGGTAGRPPRSDSRIGTTLLVTSSGLDRLRDPDRT